MYQFSTPGRELNIKQYFLTSGLPQFLLTYAIERPNRNRQKNSQLTIPLLEECKKLARETKKVLAQDPLHSQSNNKRNIYTR